MKSFFTEIPGGQHPSLDDQLYMENGTTFVLKIHSGSRNRLIPVSVEWGGLRRKRAHRVKGAAENFNVVLTVAMREMVNSLNNFRHHAHSDSSERSS
ncbi:hypothetical protein AVEN_231693-1 [Araneus ventricosus]|uniref:Uncharacterized protein n=1 Tax=Araneus ventricosus TaxID=182803 RepID=A0A4Y2TF77_ARAVE|nr:hypothetical protein AVEN_231693-1 [Araneus ventricosus]